jgi:hypothetical protein
MASDEATALKVMSVFADALDQKDIQLYFNDSGIQEPFADRGWTGRLAPLPPNFDSLLLVRSNIAGAKTDAVMETAIDHASVIAPDGRVTDHVTITLHHGGIKGKQFTGVRNVTYLRLYVPQGSRLIKASGDIRPPAPALFDLPPEGCAPDESLSEISGPILHDPTSGTAINEEFGRTVFGTWTQTDPGATSTVSFDYDLPFAVRPTAAEPTLLEQIGLAAAATPIAPFGLLIEKQPGADRTEIHSSLKLPSGWYPSFASPEGTAETDGWTYTSSIDSDKAIGVIISK